MFINSVISQLYGTNYMILQASLNILIDKFIKIFISLDT